jgi:2'-hydroxyisoflavone reductase
MSMLTRRELIKIGAYAAAANYLPRSIFAADKKSPKKILILGGTGFLGPPVVERALQRGHTVTLFNRGKTGTDLFPNVEKIRGDREKNDLTGLTNDRHWDAVVDVWANDPNVVVPMANLLAQRTSYYHFVSSISAYADYSKIGMDETAPTRIDRSGYGGNKAKSEKALTDLLGDRLGICRPCAIMGPRDDSLSYHYWLSHLMTNQEIVAPGTGDDCFVQYVDVRDVANWIIDCVEQSRGGIYNVVSAPVTFRIFLGESSRGIGGKATPVWIDSDFLRNEQHVKTFDNLPYWNPDRPGFARISPAKARANGFAARPLSATAKDAWASYQKMVPANLVYPQKQDPYEWGLSGEREREILAAWRKKNGSS